MQWIIIIFLRVFGTFGYKKRSMPYLAVSVFGLYFGWVKVQIGKINQQWKLHESFNGFNQLSFQHIFSSLHGFVSICLSSFVWLLSFWFFSAAFFQFRSNISFSVVIYVTLTRKYFIFLWNIFLDKIIYVLLL